MAGRASAGGGPSARWSRWPSSPASAPAPSPAGRRTPAGSWSRPAGQPYLAGRAGQVEVQRLAAVRELLDRRASALLRRDRAGWLAAVDPAARALRARQAAFFGHVAAVPLGAWRYTVEPDDEKGEPAAAPAGRGPSG